MHSYNSGLFHCVFCTKDRRRLLNPEVRPRLWRYFCGTARVLGLKILAIGGIEDDVHILFSLPGTVGVAECVQKLKANSSRWMHEEGHRLFSWQKGYGAFSIGVAQIEATTRYIQDQEEHHKKLDFGGEFRLFLDKHGIELQDEL